MTRLTPSATDTDVNALATNRPRKYFRATVRVVTRAPRRARGTPGD